MIFYSPVQNPYITSKFGKRGQNLHGGVDFRLPQGGQVLASQSGTVARNALDKFGGAYTDIEHGNGWFTRYLHLSKFLVKPGQKVKPGQLIALGGGTPGTWGAGKSTGPHLHFEIHKNRLNNRVDPLQLIQNMNIKYDEYTIQANNKLEQNGYPRILQSAGDFDTFWNRNVDIFIQQLNRQKKMLNKQEAKLNIVLDTYNENLNELKNEIDNSDKKENSSTKPFYKSKKFWISLSSLVASASIAFNLNPEQVQTVEQLIAMITTILGVPLVATGYNAYQSSIDKKAIEVQNKT